MTTEPGAKAPRRRQIPGEAPDSATQNTHTNGHGTNGNGHHVNGKQPILLTMPLSARPGAPVALAEGQGGLDALHAVLPPEWAAAAFPTAMWSEIDWSCLTGRRPIIIPENTPFGADRASKLEEYLRHVGIAASVLALPEGIPEGWKLTDGMPEGLGLFNEPLQPRGPLGQIFSAADLDEQEFAPLEWIIEGWLPVGLTFLVGASKLGKAQPCDTLIPTPTGWRRIDAILPGDEVFAADGSAARVLARHPQGESQIFEVETSDGLVIEATAEHLWEIQTRDDRSANRGFRLATTADIQAGLARGGVAYIPMCGTVEFQPACAPALDPYLVGLLLGDGGLTNGTTLTSVDEELFESLAASLPPSCISKRGKDRRVAYVVSAAGRGPGRNCPKNDVLIQLRAWGLYGKKSDHKFIPEEYMSAAPAVRWALIQGLMDTDGGLELGYPMFTTCSKHLARQFAELVQSFGGTCKIGLKLAPKYRHNGELRTGLTAYRLRPRFPIDSACPFRLARKATAWSKGLRKMTKRPVRRIVAVRQGRKSDAVCITIARDDGLYLTSHYAVTHNSWMAMDWATEIAAGRDVFGKISTKKCDVLYLALEDGPRRLQSRMRKMLGNNPSSPGLTFATEWPTFDKGGIEKLAEYLDAVPTCRVIIVDILARVRGEPDEKKSMYLQDYKDIGELQRFSHLRNIALVLVHHTRKQDASDALDRVSGSTGMVGAADTIMILTRPRGEPNGKLVITGRDIIDDGEFAVVFNKETAKWTLLGPAAQVKAETEQKRIYDLLLVASEPMTGMDISAELEIGLATVRSALQRMKSRGAVLQVKHGIWGIVGKDYKSGKNRAD